jgi:hypothetical protein
MLKFFVNFQQFYEIIVQVKQKLSHNHLIYLHEHRCEFLSLLLALSSKKRLCIYGRFWGLNFLIETWNQYVGDKYSTLL